MCPVSATHPGAARSQCAPGAPSSGASEGARGAAAPGGRAVSALGSGTWRSTTKKRLGPIDLALTRPRRPPTSTTSAACGQNRLGARVGARVGARSRGSGAGRAPGPAPWLGALPRAGRAAPPRARPGAAHRLATRPRSSARLGCRHHARCGELDAAWADPASAPLWCRDPVRAAPRPDPGSERVRGHAWWARVRPGPRHTEQRRASRGSRPAPCPGPARAARGAPCMPR